MAIAINAHLLIHLTQARIQFTQPATQHSRHFRAVFWVFSAARWAFVTRYVRKSMIATTSEPRACRQ